MQVNSLKQITFKEIIQHYKKQPQAKTDVFRTVVTAQSDPDLNVTKTGDIIEFYNAVFIPTVKSFVLKLGSRKAQLTRCPPAQDLNFFPLHSLPVTGALIWLPCIETG